MSDYDESQQLTELPPLSPAKRSRSPSRERANGESPSKKARFAPYAPLEYSTAAPRVVRFFIIAGRAYAYTSSNPARSHAAQQAVLALVAEFPQAAGETVQQFFALLGNRGAEALISDRARASFLLAAVDDVNSTEGAYRDATQDVFGPVRDYTADGSALVDSLLEVDADVAAESDDDDDTEDRSAARAASVEL
jgi:hypothetical protein